MNLRTKGELLELFDECVTIQESLNLPNVKADISFISKKFRILMEKGDMNGALNFFD